MCAAAVEQGLLLYQTGKIQTEDEQKAEIQAALDKGDTTLAEELEAFYVKLKTFSEGGWSKPTQDYIKVIGKLSEGQWKGIIKAGMKHVKQPKGLPKTQEVEVEDERALMIVDDDDRYSGDSE
ncbi:hypothetical protein EW026_g7085 [Hermanssonia centrifuga]|uniref:Uncharacterized protein n=1 Tax=Hermanssonia centrifuga TaxID=98765 RepID=A0A4S4K8Y1_9APHY|nr:hypothetical protein EW026_g7085 [Hermanssonia centrifuga]